MTDANRIEQVHAVSAVMRRQPNEAWFDDPTTGANGVLDALFGPSGKYRGQYSPKRTPKPFVSRVYKYPVPIGPGGYEYRSRVRAWGRKQGHKVLIRGVLEGWLLNAYVEATGDIWGPA